MKICNLIYIFPLLAFFVVLNVNPNAASVDLEAQLYSLSYVENTNISEYIESQSLIGKPFFYQSVYAILHQSIGLNAKTYIAILTFVYYLMLIIVINAWNNKLRENITINKTFILIILFTSMNPLFFAVSRFFFAVILVIMALVFELKKRYFIGGILLLLAPLAHDGIKIVFLVLILAVFFSWRFKNNLSKVSRINRNVWITITCIAALIGSTPLIQFLGRSLIRLGLLQQSYSDSYLDSVSSEGYFKFIIVLMMLGPLLVLYVNTILYRRTDFLYYLSVSILICVCAVFNYKIFMVQRYMMFAPFILALTTQNIMNDYNYGIYNMPVWYLSVLMLIPFCFFLQIYLAPQFFFPFFY